MIARRPAPGSTHEVVDRDVRREIDEHMNVVARQRTVDDRHGHVSADLPDNISRSVPHLSVQHLEPVLMRPDKMMAMLKGRAATG